jgi:hypothetical protein
VKHGRTAFGICTQRHAPSPRARVDYPGRHNPALGGELQHWSATWFNPAPGGPWAIVGIVWLVPVFGIYFALKLEGAGQGPPSVPRAIGFAILGAIFFALGFVLFQNVFRSFIGLALMWALAAAGAALQFPTWRGLSKVLIAYGYAARIPVAIVMFLATQADWKSHYSALALPVSEMNRLAQYFLFGFVPQLVWWVSFTIVVGSLFGSVAALFHRGRQAVGAA